jgi:hypothetical protein
MPSGLCVCQSGFMLFSFLKSRLRVYNRVCRLLDLGLNLATQFLGRVLLLSRSVKNWLTPKMA